jgi:hypothetical protein
LRPHPAGLVLAAAALAALALGALSGCGSPVPSGSAPAGSIAAATVGPPASSGPAPSASDPGASGPSGSAAAVVADPSLLALVPTKGIKLMYDPDTTARVAADPTLATSANALAIAVATPDGELTPGSSAAPGADLAVVSVIRLRDPAADDAWFRDWRDSYDEASCANAGGVVRRAETTIGSVPVFVGSCAGGSFTYHARVDGGAAVISLTSIGPGQLGQSIMAALGA